MAFSRYTDSEFCPRSTLPETERALSAVASLPMKSPTKVRGGGSARATAAESIARAHEMRTQRVLPTLDGLHDAGLRSKHQYQDVGESLRAVILKSRMLADREACDENFNVPSDAVSRSACRFRAEVSFGVGRSAVRRAGRFGQGRAVLQLDARRADSCGRQGHRRHLRQRASSERVRLHAESGPDGIDSRARDQRHRCGCRADGSDAADLESADPNRGRVFDDRLHQRRPFGGRDAAGDVAGREPLLRNSADRAARAILRSARPDYEGVAVTGDFRVERQVLQTADGEYMAAADSEAASSRLDSRQRQPFDLGFYRQAQPLLLLPVLLGK